ncbi:S-layer homology domain-containing protein [Cohnella abietis]|nr:S-layer homology domain-containing protein [Cohnella abietis]
MEKKNDRFRKTAYLLLAVILWIPLLASGGGKAAAAGGWSMIDGGGPNGLNVTSTNLAEYPALAAWNGEVYVAWQEKIVGNNPNQIRVKKFDSTGWKSVDGNGPYGINMAPGIAGTQPTMAVYDDALYVAWVEGVTSSLGKIRVKKYSSAGWSPAEGSLTGINYDGNNGANSPTLVVYKNALYASWIEASKLRVKMYTGGEWASVDGGAEGLNKDPNKAAAFPALAVLGNDLIAVWSEQYGSIYQLRAKKYNGTSWTPIDGNGVTGLNIKTDKSAYSPSLIAADGDLYAAWNEPVDATNDDQIRVKKYDGNVWTSIDGNGKNGINVDPSFRAYQVKLAVVNHEVHAVWSENWGWVGSTAVFKIRAKKYNGSVWTSAEAGLNGFVADSSKAAFNPAITTLNNATFVAWQEKNTSVEQIRVNYMPAPAVNSVTVTPPSPISLAQGGSKQLQASVDAQGGAATTLTWTSSDSSSKVAVDGTGNVTVAADAAPGDYTITATSTFDNSKKATVTIKVLLPAVISVSFSQGSASIQQGLYRQIGFTVNVVEGTPKTLNWTSSDVSNKVAVNGTGLVTVASDAVPGSYTITATSTFDNSKKATMTITVTAAPAVNSVTVTPATYSVVQGGSKQLAVMVDAAGGATTNVTWSSSDASNKVAVSGTGNVTVAANAVPDDYTITATSTFNNSKKGTATITVTAAPVAEARPAAQIDYAAEQLTGLVPNGAYTIKGTAVTADSNGKLEIDGSWLGTTVNVVKKGNGTTTIDSLAQALSLPARPATPTAGKTDETSINGNDGTLTNVTSAMEYKKGTSGSWADVTGTSVTELEPDTYSVRFKATSSAFASQAQLVTISTFGLSPEATPVAVIDYAGEQLTGLVPNASYTIKGTAVTANSNGEVTIDESWLGTTVNVVKKGNGTTSIDSVAQALILPVRPATPTAGKTDETSINGNNGSLTNVTSAMEYKKGTGGSWQDLTGTSLTGLEPDTYYVRAKATSSAFASVAQTVTIAAFNASHESTPVAVIDYAGEQLTGLVPNAPYTINGTDVTANSDGEVTIDESWLRTTVNVVKKGNGTTTTDSAAQTISLPARPATPTAGKTDETSINGNNGTLTNVTSSMEYKKGTGGSWTDVTGTSLTGLEPDTYYVRVKATSSAFASESQQVTISTYGSLPEATPAAGIDYAAEQLTGLEPNETYTINGTTVTADGNGKVAINGSWLGATVNVVKKGNGTTTTDSAEQTLSLPARPAAPVDITVTDVTYNGANDGSILNLNLTMEYKKGNTGTWTNTSGTSEVGLEPGVYYVRVAATQTAFASIPAQVTIHDSGATIPAAPNVNADDASNVIVGLDTTMEFSVDGGAYVRYNGTNMPQLSGEHTVLVRVAASGSVPAGPSTTLIFTTNVSVPAGGLTVTAGDPSGSANDGKTRITVTPGVNGEHRLVYFNFGSGTVKVPNVGDTLSGYSNVPSDLLIPAANGDKIGIAEVDAQGRVVKFGQTAAIVIVEQSGPQPTNGTSTDTNEEAVDVLINGKVENAGKATTTESVGIKTTTVVVDPAKLKAKLESEGVNAVVTIPVKSASNVIVGELNGQMVKNMENLSATLVLQTSKGTYTLPAKEINIDEVAGKFGSNVKLDDIQLKISIAQTSDTMAKVVKNAEAEGKFSVVVPALDFTVTGTYGGKTVEVTKFNVYVERMVALPEGIDPNKITTGVVVEPDGTVRHVPTKIVVIDGKHYAQINSLTNSTYSVVWHPLEFLDVANHWAKSAVNDMGSRMVIDGTGNGLFSPGRDITRAEFAAILVRGLGLKLENSSTVFSDVKTSNWFSSAINTAYSYKLIEGFENGTFRPNDKITREQAMMILSRAMAITGLKAKLSTQSDDTTLRSFRDELNVSGWAHSSVIDSVQAGLVSGRSATELAPKAFITRAEVATIIQRLLQTSGLI